MSDFNDINELHWLLGVIQHVDVGVVVLDRDYRVKLWNGFMENHSGLTPSQVVGYDLFVRFPELDAGWLRRRAESVFLLNHTVFSTWQQRPYLFRFNSYRPITGASEWMYQNITLFPLHSVTGKVEHICLIIYDVTESAMDEKALAEANRELDRLGRTDGLTGLYNRRAWEELLSAEFKREQRKGETSVLAMFDIDHFKRINDNYGHPAGDEVIRRVAQLAVQCKRESDIAGRYGGEEFGVILVDTDLEGAAHFAERLRRAVEATVVEYDGNEIRFTVSIGLAINVPQQDSYTQWLEQADQALYKSKQGGRNKVSLYRAQ